MSIDPNRRLTPNITLGEMCATNHQRFKQSNLVFGARNEAKLRLVAAIPQAARTHFAMPVKIHSGAREPSLNRAVGGSSRSQHMICEAVDFSIPGVPLEQVWRWLALESGLEFGQLILEYDSRGRARWIHASLGHPYRDAARSQQVMVSKFVKGKRTYKRVKP